jgi:hypothetical protein
VQTTAYTTFRFLTTATGLTSGARFQIDEIEYFDSPVPEPGSAMVAGGIVAVMALGRRRRA